MKNQFDVVIVGSGVLGTFHAYQCLLQGLKVAIVEKDKRSRGSSTMNFGQVVPSGFNSKWQTYGIESLNIYKDLQSKFDLSVRQNGSVYVASNQEELQLLEELHHINASNGYSSTLLTKLQCLDRYPGLNPHYATAGLFFPDEVTVEPHTMIHRLHGYMTQQMGLDIFWQCPIVSVSSQENGVTLESSNGHDFKAEKVIICSGYEFKMLYPDVYLQSDMEVCKLQMLSTKPQPSSYKLDGSILTGWTIRRYESFHECPSYFIIKAKEEAQSPQKKWGVHILFKQAADGSVILGDSHEYADAKDIDDLDFNLNMDIDQFMIEESKKIIDLPTYEIQSRWYGLYAQCKNTDVFLKTMDRNIHIVTGIGGKGMTGSAGFAKENIKTILNK